MRVLLTLPPDVHGLEIYKVTGMKAPPLGLAYIASVLERRGHRVRIIDTPTLEMDFKTWLREVRSWGPDVVGFSLLTPTAPRGYRAIRVLRREMPDTIVIVGGIHPTFMYEEALDSGAHIVVRGEGEYTTAELVDVLERYGLDWARLKAVRGIAFRPPGEKRAIVTPPRPPVDLDELPPPARHLLPMEKYTLLGKPIRVVHVMASRGCPYGCMYCATSYFWGRRIRVRSPARVADEVEEAVYRYKARYVVFADDDIAVARKFMYEFVGELRRRGLDVSFACGSRVDHMTREYMRFLYENGCAALYFGVESASQETLNRIGKRITLEQVERVFRWKKEIGGFATASFILGFPWETLDDMRRTVEFAVKLDPDYAQFTVLTPYPGTPMFEYARRHGLIEDWNWEHYTTVRAVMRGFHFTRQQLQRMLKYAYRRFYLRASFIWRELRAGRLSSLIGVLARELASMAKELIVHPLRWGGSP